MSDFWNRRRVVSIVALAIVALVVVAYLASRLLSTPGEPQPTLMFFRVQTCEFCKAMAPIIDDIERQYRNELQVVTFDVNTAGGEGAAEEHGVVGTPTVLLFDADGAQVGKYQGVVPQTVLEQAVDGLIGH